MARAARSVLSAESPKAAETVSDSRSGAVYQFTADGKTDSVTGVARPPAARRVDVVGVQVKELGLRLALRFGDHRLSQGIQIIISIGLCSTMRVGVWIGADLTTRNKVSAEIYDGIVIMPVTLVEANHP